MGSQHQPRRTDEQRVKDKLTRARREEWRRYQAAASDTTLVRSFNGATVHARGCRRAGEKTIGWLWAESQRVEAITAAAAENGVKFCKACDPIKALEAARA